MRRLVFSALVGSLALSAALPGPAAAKNGPYGPLIYNRSITPALFFNWSMTGVPDLDQVRVAEAATGKIGLPGLGKMYCLPTSGLNLLAYLADEGIAGTGVASKDWTLDANWNEITTELAELGTAMGTDPVKGTGGTGYVNAMNARLALTGSKVVGFKPFAVQYITYQPDSTWQGPNAQTMAQQGLAGALVTPVIGYYKNETDPDDATKTVKRRTGGHMMTAVGSSGVIGGTAATIQVRNPATSYASDSVQTPYATDPHTVDTKTYKFIWKGNDDLQHTGSSTVGDWDGSNTTLFEGYFKVTSVSTWIEFSIGKLQQVEPFHVVPDPGPLKHTFDLPGKAAVAGLALSPSTPNPAYLLKGSSKVRSLNVFNGKSSTLETIPGARALTFGGDQQRLFIAGHKKLVTVDGLTGKKLDSKKLKNSLGALAFDEKNNLLVGISAGGGKLLSFDEQLNGEGSRKLKGLTGGGKPLLAIGPKGGILVSKAGKKSLFGSKSAAQIASPNAGLAARKPLKLKKKKGFKNGLHGLAIGDDGTIFTSFKKKLKLLGPSGKPIADPGIAGAARQVFAVTRSFNNAKPELAQPSLDFFPFADPQPPGHLPDLTAAKVGPRTLRVSNIGTASAPAFVVRVVLQGPPVTTTNYQVAGLAKGASTNITIPCRPGTATVDYGNNVPELSEKNNVVTLTCASTTP